MWLEGDNHASSRDSLEFGPVPMALFRGRVSAVVWPPHRARLVDRQYQTHRIAQPFGATEFSDSFEARAAAASAPVAGDRPAMPASPSGSAAAEP